MSAPVAAGGGLMGGKKASEIVGGKLLRLEWKYALLKAIVYCMTVNQP